MNTGNKMKGLKAIYNDYIENFLRLFQIEKTGSIKANWNNLIEIEKWIKSEDVILLLEELEEHCEMDINYFVFTKPFRNDIRTKNENKRLLWQIYSNCFAMYTKLCKRSRRPVDERYTLFKEQHLDIDEI